MRRPWLPFYVEDYLADTVDLSCEEHGVYVLLLGLCWRRDGRLPNDSAFLKRALSACAADMHGNRFNRIVPKLLDRFFVQDEQGYWTQKRLTIELEKARNLSGTQTEKAKKRWGKHRKNNGTTSAAASAPALPEHSQSQSLPSKGNDCDVIIEEGTPEQTAWHRHDRDVLGKPGGMLMTDITRPDGLRVRGARRKTRWPPGYQAEDHRSKRPADAREIARQLEATEAMP